MRISRIVAFLLSAVLLVSLCACGQSTSSSNNHEINVALGSEPNTLDPALSLTIDARSYLSHVFEGLTVLSENGIAEPGVAMSWTASNNNTKYTFFIREDAVWSDGSKVTANDFIYAWLRVLNPETASGWASYLYYIKGAEAYNNGKISAEDVGLTEENGNLVVQLESPCSFFPEMTAMQPYYPVKQEIIDRVGDSWASSSEPLVSNGPYYVQEWKHDEVIRLEKNTSYWRKNTEQPDAINFFLMSDSSATMNAYESGLLDFTENILTNSEMAQLDTVQSCDFTITKFLALNMKREIFSDLRVREAIAIAIDRAKLSEIVGGNCQPLLRWVPRGFINPVSNLDYQDEAEAKIYYNSNSDLEKAKQLLSDAGYPDGNGFPVLSYLTNTSSSNIQLAEAIKFQLQQLGITIKIDSYESKIFNEYRYKRDYDIVAASWASEYPDISSYFYGMQSTDINNYASFSSEDYDNLYLDALAISDISKRFECYHTLEDYAMSSFAFIPLYATSTEFIASNNLSGFYHDSTGCLHFIAY